MSDEKKTEKKKFKRPLLNKIVNVFIALISGFLFLLIIFFGFSQTKTFRNYLKDQITQNVSETINGELKIDSIEGSILSSIILYNTQLISNSDTIFTADELAIKTSPIHLFLKRILIRELIIKNSKVKLFEDNDGLWNYSKLSKGEKETQPQVSTDTTTSTFPFTIQINNLKFENLNFIKQTYKNVYSNRSYKYLTSDDLQLSNINLDAKLFANLSNSTVRVRLNNFSVKPNFESFNLKKLSGDFELTKNYARVSNLVMATDSSEVNITAKVDELNLLGNIELKDFKEYPIELKFQTYPLNLSDLYTFIRDIDFLNGSIYLDMKAKGYFGDFDVEKLKLNFLTSYLNLNGNVKNLHTPEKLYFDCKIEDSRIVETEVFDLIKGLDIPRFENLIVNDLNVIFKGEPSLFNTQFSGNVNNGNVFIDTYMNLQQEEMEYDISFNSRKLNLFPILNFNTSLTSNGKIKGVGTDPNFMSAFLNINVFNSLIDSIEVDSLYLISKIDSKLLDVNLTSIINDAKFSIGGDLDLRNEIEPIYDLVGKANKLQLNNFTGDPKDSSNLNLTFNAKGKNLKLDELVGQYEITLEPSYLRNLSLDETSIQLSLLKEEEQRKINLKSDFVDFNIDGQFSLDKAVDIIVYETETISKIISDKMDELNPIEDSDSVVIIDQNLKIPDIAKENLEFNFNFLFKDFDLIAQFLKNDELDIVGSGEGTVYNDSLHFEISSDINIVNLLNKKRNDIFYLSNIDANINFSRDNREVSFNKIFGTISVEGEKLYSGIELNDITADLVFNQSKLFFNTSLTVDDYLTTEIEGLATTSLAQERIDFKNISINYKNLPWTSIDTCFIIFNGDGVQLSDLILENGSTVISLDGQLNNDESHNFFIGIDGMPGEVLSNYLLSAQNEPFAADINLKLVSSGFISNPNINLELNILDLAYNDVDFGSLTCVARHLNSSTLFDIDFLSSDPSITSPLLTLDATAPLKINYLGSDSLLSNDDELRISLRSNNFDIESFGNVLPYIKTQSGKVESKIDIKGSINHLNSNGYFRVENGKFTLRENNLDYGFDISTIFNNQLATLETLTLYNSGGSEYNGTIKGKGTIGLQYFPFSDFNITLNGNLALLGKKSQTRNSTIYGDLLIKSSDDWVFKYENENYSFKGDVIIDKADLVYAMQNNGKTKQNGNIVYHYLVDTSKINVNNQKFVKILNETRLTSLDLTKSEPSIFNIETNIIITNIASFNFLISEELGQKLNVETTGRLQFETIGNETKTQGSLSLLNGSRLEFFKTFDATGTIRFENDIADPHFDVVATYIGEIENFKNTSVTEEVAVKLKLNTAYSKLRENLSGNKENLTVYVGRTDIENDVPDPTFDQSNALTFVIFNQLSLDLNNEQRTTLANMTGNAAFSLLSSQLTGLLNSTFGGLINNIQVNKYSSKDSYKLLFSGKYNNIRYSFGGDFGSQTDYLQLSKADIKLEYLLNPNFLIRIEQKDPVIQTTTEEKIRQFGLKYKFEF